MVPEQPGWGGAGEEGFHGLARGALVQTEEEFRGGEAARGTEVSSWRR